jgi:hypothetical protein
MSSAGYSYTCGGQGGKYEDHANHFGYGDGTPGNGNTNVRIGSQLLEEASGVAFNDGNCCGIFGMENCHINATLVPKFEAFIASLFLLGKKSLLSRTRAGTRLSLSVWPNQAPKLRRVYNMGFRK